MLTFLLKRLWQLKVDIILLWGCIFLVCYIISLCSNGKISRKVLKCYIGVITSLVIGMGLFRIFQIGEPYAGAAFFYLSILLTTGFGVALWLLPVYLHDLFFFNKPKVKKIGLLYLFGGCGIVGFLLFPANYCDSASIFRQPQIQAWVEEEGGFCAVDSRRFVVVIDLSETVIDWANEINMLRYIHAIELGVSRTSFDSPSLKAIASHSDRSLRKLDISFTSIGDKDLPVLLEFEQLKQLLVSKGQFSEMALSKLQEHKINIYVQFD